MDLFSDTGSIPVRSTNEVSVFLTKNAVVELKGSQVIDGTGEDKTITTWVLNPGLLAVDGNEHHESWRREYSRTSKSQRKWQQSTGYGRQRHIISVRVAFSKQGTRVKIPLVEQAIQFRPNTKKLNFGTYIAR